MKSVRGWLGLVLFPFAAFGYPMVPDSAMTPGHLCTTSNKDFSGFRYREKVPYCQRRVSSETKEHVYQAYRIPKAERGEYTIDHFYPLSMGGSNDVRNLWPEHKDVKARRPSLESDLFEELSRGKMTQKEVLSVILEEKLNP